MSLADCVPGMQGWGPRVMSGMGGLTATAGDKSRLTAQADTLLGLSRSAPSDQLRGQIAGAMVELNQYDPWTDDTSSWFSFAKYASAVSGSYSASQMIRSKLQQANGNISIATGVTSSGDTVSSTWQTQPNITEVNVADETLKNVPGEVQKQAQNMTSCSFWPSPLDYVCNNPTVSIGIVGAAALAWFAGPKIWKTARKAIR